VSLRILPICWCVLMCIASPARAHQVQLGIEQGLDVDSNVLGTNTVSTTDGLYRITPTLAFDQPESDFTYALRYRPTYSGYFTTDGINGWDQALVGKGGYQINGRDRIEFLANYVNVRGIRSNSFVDAVGQTQVLATQPGTTSRLETELSFDHGFSGRTTGRVGLRYDRWDYSIPERIDNQGYGASVEVSHALMQRLSLGLNVDGRYRAFEELGSSPASYSTVLNSNLLARFRVTESLSVDLSGGPAGVFSRQSEPAPQLVSRWDPVGFNPLSCPIGPCGRVWGGVPAPAVSTNCGTAFGVPVLNRCGLTGLPVTSVPGFPEDLVYVRVDPNQVAFGRSTDSLTYFVQATIVQRFRKGSLNLSFVRNEDGGSGLGSTSIVNFASAGFKYSLTDLWELSATGSYFLRESVSNFPTTEVSARPSSQTFGGNTLAEAGAIVANLTTLNFEQRVGSVDVSLLRQLSQRSRLRFRFRYYNQSQGTFGGSGTSGFDKFVAGVFYVYQFDPYKF